MAKEILAVPESALGEVIRVIRAGLAAATEHPISPSTKESLETWCDEEEEYLNRKLKGLSEAISTLPNGVFSEILFYTPEPLLPSLPSILPALRKKRDANDNKD